MFKPIYYTYLFPTKSVQICRTKSVQILQISSVQYALFKINKHIYEIFKCMFAQKKWLLLYTQHFKQPPRGSNSVVILIQSSVVSMGNLCGEWTWSVLRYTISYSTAISGSSYCGLFSWVGWIVQCSMRLCLILECGIHLNKIGFNALGTFHGMDLQKQKMKKKKKNRMHDATTEDLGLF